jgi:hypothetical protein
MADLSAGNGLFHPPATPVTITGCLKVAISVPHRSTALFSLEYMNVDRMIIRGIDSRLFGQLRYNNA